MSSDTEIRVENMLAGIHGVDASSSVNGRNVVEKYPEPTAVAPYKLGAGKEGLASSMSAAHIDKDKLNAELRDNQRLLKVCIWYYWLVMMCTWLSPLLSYLPVF